MTGYHVIWEIDVDADNPLEAATKAREYQQFPREGYWCGVFEVIDEAGNNGRVDLDAENARHMGGLAAMIPQIIITLSPQGTLQAELPGHNGHRRILALDRQSMHDSLVRILRDQSNRYAQGLDLGIGVDGFPTQAQIEHWEHDEWPSDKCPFCRAEGRVPHHMAGGSKRSITLLDRDGIRVRRIVAGKRGQKMSSKKSAEELGL